MIPIFPIFKKLELEDRQEIDQIVQKFPPSSEHSFSSLYCWDTLGQVQLSNLNGNLVILLTDFLSNKKFLTFIGDQQITSTIETLFEYLKSHSELPRELRLILSECLAGISREKFQLTEDRNYFDYIFSLEELSTLQGNKYRGKRNFVNRFNKFYQYRVEEINLTSEKIWKDVKDLYELWASRHITLEGDADNESMAIDRFKRISKEIDSCNFGVYQSEKLIGYTFNELNKFGYVTNHLEHGNTDFTGIFPVLKNQTAIRLLQKGFKYLSHQEDLGLENLRKSKMDWQPVSFLKKFTVTLAN